MAAAWGSTMTSAISAIDASSAEKFQSLLRELFQFDCADLDFGIYRIMNHKRAAVERFITERLPAAVADALSRGPLAQQVRADVALADLRARVEQAYGEDAVGFDGQLVVSQIGNMDAPLVKQYIDALARAADDRNRASVEDAIYNHLITFFSRYYEEGDFISKRRYSRSRRYAIPYNGEEVYLHWANRDQYYVKTDEHFRNYDWQAPNGVAVRFRLRNADVEQNNVKGDRRFFLPVVADVRWDDDARTVTIPVEYRPLRADEQQNYGTRNQQDKIIADAVAAIPPKLAGAPDAHIALAGAHRQNAKGEPVSRLEHHLRRYTTRNNADFFVHKDLSGFLNQELDFYLKNEVLNLDNIANAGQEAAEGWFQQMRLIKAVGGQVIDFLAQIEDFQKTLWEKRKFVTATHYCITLGNISADFYPDIIANAAQWHEWRELFDIDTDAAHRTANFLQTHPTLPLDTRHFNAAFTNRLLAAFDDLDGMTDGVLFHGDNWQALRLITEKYAGKVNCIYIDPPYNTAASEILYKNGYKHSSYLSLIADRISISQSVISDDAAWVIAIDDTEMTGLAQILDTHFNAWDRSMVVVNHHPAGSGLEGTNVSSTHEYAIFMTPANAKVLGGPQKESGISEIGFVRTGTADSNLRTGRPNSFYAVLVDPKTSTVIGAEPPPTGTDYPRCKTSEGYVRIYPVSDDGTERVWRRSYVTVTKCIENGEIICKNSRSLYLLTDQSGKRRPLFSNWTDKKYNAGTHGSNLLRALFGGGSTFSYPKSVWTVRDCVDACIHKYDDAVVLDYFAGSGTTGHAVINLNREDGGRRKFVLVEMGEYFDTVLLPRIKKVVFTPEWKDGKPRRAATPEESERSPRIIKYMTLESYEDALDSIEFDSPAGQLPLLESSDEYLLKYLLRSETRESETLLNVTGLTAPFTYRLRVHVNGERQERTVDLPETFNYLLGLNVRTRRAYADDGRRYLAYSGETRAEPGRTVAVIWRATDGWAEHDFVRDREFIAAQDMAAGAETVYVNGDSAIIIPRAKPIEPMFKARMFAGVSA